MEWNPTQFFQESTPPTTPYALLILNQPINENAFGVLQKHASITVCADGGANWYYDLMKSYGKESVDLPSAIVGDLDSIDKSVRRHYEDLDVHVVELRDDYSTDFTKSLYYLRDWYAGSGAGSGTSTTGNQASGNGDINNKNIDATLNIVILGGLGGRVDQAFSQIHHLYTGATMSMDTKAARPPPNFQHQNGDTNTNTNTSPTKTSTPTPTLNPRLNLFLISEESITFILHRGQNVIYTPGTNRPGAPQRQQQQQQQQQYYLEENVGIIPILGPTRISTSGFEWDVTDWLTEIGGRLSTSNHVRADVVSVECERSVLFTVELARRLKVGAGRKK